MRVCDRSVKFQVIRLLAKVSVSKSLSLRRSLGDCGNLLPRDKIATARTSPRSDTCRWVFCEKPLKLFALVLFLTSTARADDDAAIRERIRVLTPLAEKLIFDGRADDWRDLPAVPDALRESADGTRDISALALAPRADDLWVRIETRERASRDKRAWWLDLDFHGRYNADVRLNISQESNPPGGASRAARTLWIYEENRKARFVSVSGIEVVVADHCIEIRIPFSALEKVLDPVVFQSLTQSARRTWLRAWARAWDEKSQRWRDAASAASYRLIEKEYTLDLPHPHAARAEPPLPLDLPMSGRWMVAQGGFSSGTHKNDWAYDFWIMDRSGATSPHDDGGDYSRARTGSAWAFGQEIRAPFDARVLLVRDGLPDKEINAKNLQTATETASGNYVVLEAKKDMRLEFLHLKNNSVSVRANERVRAGDKLGAIGNSGRTVSPHLHLQARRISNRRVTVPLVLKRVRVRLNNLDDDAWARTVENWMPREGFFVENIATPEQR